MRSATIIAISGLGAIPLVALVNIIFFFNIKKQITNQIMPFENKRPFHFLGVLLVMPIVIILTFYRSFDTVTTLAITASGLLGFIIAFKDILFSRINGLYFNALIWHGEVLFFQNIDCVNRIDPYSLEIITITRNRKIISEKNIVRINAIENAIEVFQNSTG